MSARAFRQFLVSLTTRAVVDHFSCSFSVLEEAPPCSFLFMPVENTQSCSVCHAFFFFCTCVDVTPLLESHDESGKEVQHEKEVHVRGYRKRCTRRLTVVGF